MKCIYCEQVKPNSEVFTDADPDTYAQVSYAVCRDCLLDNSRQKVWSSYLSSDQVLHLSANEISMLVNALNDSVMEICQSYDIE